MKLKTLISTVKDKIIYKMDFYQSIIIINIPKQKILNKGTIIFLLNKQSDILFGEWFNNKNSNIKLVGILNNKFIKSVLKNKKLRLLNSILPDILINKDFIIEYKFLSSEEKKLLKDYIISSEEQIHKKYTSYDNKFNKVSWEQSIKLSSNYFVDWCKDSSSIQECIENAIRIANKNLDINLKRRAILNKCFIDIKKWREKNG